MLQPGSRLLAGNSMNRQHIVVFSNGPDDAVAGAIPATLTGERLTVRESLTAAVRSTYSRDAAVRDSPETRLTLKIQASRRPDLEPRIRALHLSERPEIMAVPVVSWLDRVSGMGDAREHGTRGPPARLRSLRSS